MTQDLAFLQVDDRLGDLGCVVGDSFQISRCIDQPEPGVDPFWVTDNFEFELLQDRTVIKVHLIISVNDVLGP